MTGSTAIDAAIGTFSFLTNDILDGTRDSSFDVGIEEFNTGGTSGAYTSTDVGVIVGFGASGGASSRPNETFINLEDNLILSEISIYPNPTTANGFVNVTSEVNTLSKIRLMDLGGKVLIDTQATGQKTTLDVSQLKRGVYILNVAGAGNTKLIVE